MVDAFFDKLPDYIQSVMGYASPLIVIAVIIALVLAYRKTRHETAKAQESAALLGLRYCNVADEMKKDHREASFLLGLLSNWSPWAMEGKYAGIPVRVELIVKSRQQRVIECSDRASLSNPARTSYSRGTEYTVPFAPPFLLISAYIARYTCPSASPPPGRALTYRQATKPWITCCRYPARIHVLFSNGSIHSREKRRSRKRIGAGSDQDFFK